MFGNWLLTLLRRVCETLVNLAVALDGIERLRKRALGSDTGGRTTCFSNVNMVIFQSSCSLMSAKLAVVAQSPKYSIAKPYLENSFEDSLFTDVGIN